MWHDLRHDVPAKKSVTCVITWIRGPTRARNRHNKSHSSCHWQVGLELNPIEEGQGQLGPLGGRPTTLVGLPAHGPHWLKTATWSLLLGCIDWFQEAYLQIELPSAVASSYKYKGGVKKWDTHHTQHTSHLHSFFLGSLKIFILEALDSLGGVED